jgi:hypothetical protein
MQRGLALSFLLASSLSVHAVRAAQDDDYRYAYLSHVEGEVSLQRASESEPESGTLNVPILPGDRLWTRAGSRAEIRFGSGLVVRLSEGAKLDFVALDSETILRLWSGSAILKVPESPAALRVDSPAGSIRPTREGSYRIDVEDGDAVTLSVDRGSAELTGSQGTVSVQSGETSFATPSGPPSTPAAFNTARIDEFDRWSESREASRSRTQDIVVRSLPHAVQSYAYDLSYYGDWYPEPDYGYVWYPRVEVGWAPYTYGRWGYTYFGHTWISSEPWGWAPYHYGRWGFGHRGWYWIPGAAWGPAWVSFAIGPTWVGWGPLGYHNRPVFVFNSYFGGYGGSYYGGGGYHHRGGWNVCSRDDFQSGVVTRAGYRRLEPDTVRGSVGNARFVDEVSSLDRELNPRTARLRSSGSAPRASVEASRGSSDGRRSEEAIRGFRERTASSAPRVLEDTGRTLSRRGERPSEISDVVRRAREIRNGSDVRERPAQEREGLTERSRARERVETSETPQLNGSAIERRERFNRARERAEPILGARETPQSGESARLRRSSPSSQPSQLNQLSQPRSSRTSRSGGESMDSRGPRARVPETREPESRTESRRARPTMPAMPMRESPVLERSGGGRSFRERGSSVGSPRSERRGGSDIAQRAGGSRGSRVSQGSHASHASQGRSARSRSNRN